MDRPKRCVYYTNNKKKFNGPKKPFLEDKDDEKKLLDHHLPVTQKTISHSSIDGGGLRNLSRPGLLLMSVEAQTSNDREAPKDALW